MEHTQIRYLRSKYGRNNPWITEEFNVLAFALYFCIPLAALLKIYLQGTLDRLEGAIGHPFAFWALIAVAYFCIARLFWWAALRWPKAVSIATAIVYSIIPAAAYSLFQGEITWPPVAATLAAAIFVYFFTFKMIKKEVIVENISIHERTGNGISDRGHFYPNLRTPKR